MSQTCHQIYSSYEHWACGLMGRHICPGRWFVENGLWTAMAAILVVLRIDHARDSNGDKIEVKPEVTTGMVIIPWGVLVAQHELSTEWKRIIFIEIWPRYLSIEGKILGYRASYQPINYKKGKGYRRLSRVSGYCFYSGWMDMKKSSYVRDSVNDRGQFFFLRETFGSRYGSDLGMLVWNIEEVDVGKHIGPNKVDHNIAARCNYFKTREN
ncbi:uncharacterized protein EDB91DRAFT_1081465 [Suillus paluster]|uniref:uncharacterized protein n=1 Tax=Suillus paluster TaxID=48578 RepID=UPI001B87D0E3|nr:uncharacterized protein EDB91DRAFT_1081465 [Suillus paluster]KAG1742286.1 hypothetical protein EDB91DRAFT_1081465 [Suillus paluster]